MKIGPAICKILSRRAVTQQKTLSSKRPFSAFSTIPTAGKDPIFGINDMFMKDGDQHKVNLTVGAYRNDEGKPYVFPVVEKVQQEIIAARPNMEYLPILGNNEFIRLATELAYGENSECIKKCRVAGIQTLSGTGALRLAFEFVHKFIAADQQPVLVSDPTYSNHLPIMQAAGFENFKKYPYYDRENNSLRFDEMFEALEAAANGSIVLLQAVAHNPTGTDPTNEQWDKLAKMFAIKKHVAVMDMAYQGFVTGDPIADAYSVHAFKEARANILLCQSFAKNFGLYGHRVGCLSAPCAANDEKEALESQWKRIARAMHSNPPLHGARLVCAVLCSAKNRKQWLAELEAVAGRIANLRGDLREATIKAGSKLEWAHLASQKGMFFYSGLSPEQMEFLRNDFHIYGTLDGRLSLTGLRKDNLEYVAQALHAATN